MGADDYVTKPFSPRELCARVRALLPRAERGTPGCPVLKYDEFMIDPDSHRVSRFGKRVPLSALEFQLLFFLASRPGHVFTREELLDAVWGTDRFVAPRCVDVCVRRLRKKIEADPEAPYFLRTKYGAGYIFETHPR